MFYVKRCAQKFPPSVGGSRSHAIACLSFDRQYIRSYNLSEPHIYLFQIGHITTIQNGCHWRYVTA